MAQERSRSRRRLCRVDGGVVGALGGVCTFFALLGQLSPASGASTPQAPNTISAASPRTIINDARSAIDAATTVHVSGTVIDAGARLSVNLEMVKGTGGYGTVTASRSGQRVTYAIVLLRDRLYLYGDLAFWRLEGSSPAAATFLAGRWVEESAAQGHNAALASILTAHTFFAGTLALTGALKKLPPTTVLGTTVVPVTSSQKGATVYVATTGPPYPVEIALPDSESGTLVVSRINQRATVRAPASATPVIAA